MKTLQLPHRSRRNGSAILSVLIMMLIVSGAIAALASYVTQTVRLTDRRRSLTEAVQYTQGGAAVAAADLNRALTNTSAGLFVNLVDKVGYTLRSDLGNSSYKVYQRAITSPFTNQTVTVQIWLTNSTSPSVAAIKSTTIVRDVTQTSTLNVKMSFGFGAAIISDNPGSTAQGVSKSVAQQGNVVINGTTAGPTIVDGGTGLAIWSNGHANIENHATVPPASILELGYGTANAIPDYTAPGSTDQLFDFKRFIAVADVTKTHYTNLTEFFAANNAASASANGALEGVIVVDIKKSDSKFNALNPTSLPKGINIRGTLIFNFSSEFDDSDKIINTATVNINKADLSGLKPADPTTYTTGYPPTFLDASKKPSNVDISSKGFPNFSPTDDMPAMMYNVGIFDIHGNANICGVVYSPSFMEIENKKDGQIQYFRGSLIGGGGILFENQQTATSICSYDPQSLDLLATSAAKGKRVVATYWEE